MPPRTPWTVDDGWLVRYDGTPPTPPRPDTDAAPGWDAPGAPGCWDAVPRLPPGQSKKGPGPGPPVVLPFAGGAPMGGGACCAPFDAPAAWA